MKYRIAGILLMGFLWISCGNNSAVKTAASKDSTIVTQADKVLPVALFDTLENLFQNDNWLMTSGKDTSYLYCSRLGKTYFKTYVYKMIKGDSAQVVTQEITLSGDTIIWQLPRLNTPVYLKQVNEQQAIWSDKDNQHEYVFQKTDSSHIDLKYYNEPVRKLVKTIPLASFLVRSKYDFLHGTRFAFDTTSIHKK